MNDVKIFKTIGGDELISEVVEVKDTYYVLKNPSILVLSETEQGVRVGLVPFLPYAKGNIAVYAHAVTAEAIPDASMVDEYKRIFSPIEVPKQGLILPK